MNPWTIYSAEYELTLKSAAEIAEKKGYRLNPDQERVSKVVGLMTNNLVEAGKPFCPCKQSHPLNPSVDIVCPCPSWEDEIAKDGSCRCKLFFSKPKQGE